MANQVNIEVTGRDRGAGAAMKGAEQQARGLGGEVQKVGTIASGIIRAQVFTRLASGAKQAFTSTIAAASNLNESINAVGVTFGVAGDDVLAIGENAAQSMGLSERAFNEAAVTMSNFAKTVAGEGGDVSGVIEQITGRASDFASVLNLDVEEALRIFRSGLAGESEPLRRYGIDVSAAAVQTFAWSEGIAQAGQELSEQEKVQARYGLIIQQTSEMQGDFANTSDDAANAQRIMKAEIENTQALLGEEMLPVLASAAGLVTDLVVGFRDWKAGLDGWNSSGAQVVENLGGWNATGLDVIKQLFGMTEGTKAFGEVTREAAEEAATAAGSTETYEEALERAEQAAKDAEDAIKDLTTALFESGNEALDLEDKQDSLADAIDKAKEASEDDESTKRDQRAALRDVAGASHDLIETMIDQEASTKDVRDASESARRKFIDVARQLGLTKGEARRLADQYGLIPDDVETQVELIGTERARAQAERLRAKIAEIKSRTVYINAVTRASGPSSILAQFKATGGIVGAGVDGTAQGGGPRSNRVLVGEQGPEVVELPTGSRVIPSVDQAMDRGQGGGGSGSTVIEFHSDGTRMGALMLEIFREAIRVKGGDVQKVLGSG